MRNNKQAAGKILQVILQHIQCHNIQIVRWFVQNKKIWVPHEDRKQVKPALFSPAQTFHLYVMHGWREKEIIQEGIHRNLFPVGKGHHLGNIVYNIKNRILRIKTHSFLPVVTKTYGFPLLNFAADGSQLSDDKIQERTLSHPVLTYYSHFLVPGKMVSKIPEHTAFSVIIRKVPAIYDFGPQTGCFYINVYLFFIKRYLGPFL